MVGYSKSIVSGITITPQEKEIIIDTVFLKSGTTVTDEIDVTAERSTLELGLDKKVFTIGRDLNLEGGNATDVLRRIPSVTVDADGNISMRGSGNLKILIDGKPSMLTASNQSQVLEQIPAGSIESIELITNPSAKYDPEGETGIINIILKKDIGFGYNGNLSLSAGTKDKYSGSVSLNLKNKLVNVYGNYNFRLFNFGMSGNTYRQYTDVNYPQSYNEYNNASARMFGHMFKGGVDFNLSRFHIIGLSAAFHNRNRERNESTESWYYDSTGALSYLTNNQSGDNEKGYSFDLSLNYTGRFKNPKQLLTGEITYTRNKENEDEKINQRYFSPNYIENDTPYIRNSFTSSLFDNLNIQVDYTHPFKESSKLEVGYRSFIRINDNDYYSETYDTSSHQFISDTYANNRFKLNEQIHALYGIFSSKLGNFSYLGGIRLEQTFTKSEVINTGQKFNKNYFSFFPSLSLGYKFSQADEIQASYTRRINRPHSRMVNPFTDYSDPLNIRTGNPDLNPEYIDSYELNYIRYFGKFTVTPSVFFKYTHDGIARYSYLTDSNVSISTFMNLSKVLSYGAELIVSAHPFDWISFNGSASYFKTEVTGDNIAPELYNSGYSWTAKLNAFVRTWYGVDLQFAYNYDGKRVNVTGEMAPHQSLDIAVKKDIIKNRLSLSLRVSDVFNTMKFSVSQQNIGYNQTFDRKRDSRNVFLSLSYKFGTQSKEQQRKQKRENGEDNSSDDIDF